MARHEVRGGAQDLTLNADITSVSTTCQANGTVSGFPTGAVNPFVITIESERILCSSLAGSSPATITFAQRGYDGTTAAAHNANATIIHGLAAADIDELYDHVYDTSRDDHLQYLDEDRHQATTHTGDMFGAGSVDNVALATGSVDERVLAADSVGVSELQTDSVGTLELQDDAVHTANVADAQITRGKMAVPDQMPPGVIVDYAGDTAPTGWLLCDGSLKLRADYPDLFNAIGENFGAGNGITNFGLPDYRGRVGVGLDNLGGTDATRLSVANTLGAAGGEETHILTLAELAAHTHTINHDHAAATTSSDGSHTHTASGFAFMVGSIPNSTIFTNAGADADHSPAYNITASFPDSGGAHTHSLDLPNHTGTSGSTGSATPHNVMQPYLLIGKIIKY